MYYLELIQRFWDFNKVTKLSPTEISLYLYLLKIGYDKNRYDFKISDMELGKDLGISSVTVNSTKKKLKNFGLIQFQTKKGLPCCYRLSLDYSFDIKLKDEKTKEIAGTESFRTTTPLEINTIIEIKNSKNVIIPSLDELIEFAKALESYESQLDLAIKEKYESWVSNGWKNNSNRPISNWKLTLKSALPYMKNSNEVNPISLRDIPNIKHP